MFYATLALARVTKLGGARVVALEVFVGSTVGTDGGGGVEIIQVHKAAFAQKIGCLADRSFSVGYPIIGVDYHLRNIAAVNGSCECCGNLDSVRVGGSFCALESLSISEGKRDAILNSLDACTLGVLSCNHFLHRPRCLTVSLASASVMSPCTRLYASTALTVEWAHHVETLRSKPVTAQRFSLLKS